MRLVIQPRAMKNERQPKTLTALGALPAKRGLATDYGGHLHRRTPAWSAVAKDHGQRKAPGPHRYSRDNTLLRTPPAPAPSVPPVPVQREVEYARASERRRRCVG